MRKQDPRHKQGVSSAALEFDKKQGVMGEKKERGKFFNLGVLEELGKAKVSNEIDESLILEILNSSL